MNCKPGQTAQVVRNTTGHHCRERLIGGTLVVVARVVWNGLLTGPLWEISSEPVPCPYGGSCRMAYFPDADLQPLPPVADDEDMAVDEAAKRGEVAHA